MLTWTHQDCPANTPNGAGCPGKDECEHFPTNADRIAMIEAAYQAYAESDGTSREDFLADVELWREAGRAAKLARRLDELPETLRTLGRDDGDLAVRLLRQSGQVR